LENRPLQIGDRKNKNIFFSVTNQRVEWSVDLWSSATKEYGKIINALYL